MLADLSVMDAGQRAWFEKKGAIILQRDAWLHLSTISYFTSLTLKLVSFCTLIRHYLWEQLNLFKVVFWVYLPDGSLL
jgi:hypothetical protein